MSLERCRAAAVKPIRSNSTASARVSGAVYSMNSNPSVPAGFGSGASIGSPVSAATLLCLPGRVHAKRWRVSPALRISRPSWVGANGSRRWSEDERAEGKEVSEGNLGFPLRRNRMAAAGFARSVRLGLEELFDLFHPGARLRVVAPRVLAADRLEFLQELFLARGEADRRLHDHVTQQIAMGRGAHPLDAFAAQAEDLAALGLSRHLDLGRAFERGDLDVAAERRRRDADRHLAMKIVVVA